MHKIKYYENKYTKDKENKDNWIEGRKFSFGGCEIATLLGKNKYQDINNLIDIKIKGINEFNDKSQWGHLFENVALKFIKKKYGHVYNFKSVPHPYYPIAYSPDGIVLNEDKTNIRLIEIKCPLYRQIGKISDYHMAQIQVGMNIFNVEDCIFAQFRFRRCSINSHPTSHLYDFNYHKEQLKKENKKEPIIFGYLYWNSACELIDLGKTPNITDYIKNEGWYDIIIGERRKFRRGKVLMWKLFEEDYQFIKPDKNYLAEKEDLLWSNFKTLQEKMTPS